MSGEAYTQTVEAMAAALVAEADDWAGEIPKMLLRTDAPHMIRVALHTFLSDRARLVALLLEEGVLAESIRVTNSDGAGGVSVGPDGVVQSHYRPCTFTQHYCIVSPDMGANK